MISFSALDHLPLNARGGSVDSALLQLEARWIHGLKAMVYPGLNETASFKSFLQFHHNFLDSLYPSLFPIFCSPLLPSTFYSSFLSLILIKMYPTLLLCYIYSLFLFCCDIFITITIYYDLSVYSF